MFCFTHNYSVKRILPILIPVIFFLFLSSSYIYSQIRDPWGGPLSSKVQGSVGEYTLTVTGFASPNASVSLFIDGVLMRSGVADPNGNFSISQIIIKQGLTAFCLETTDNVKLASSNGCVTISPATGSVSVKDVLLPPTLALSKTEIAQGESTTAYGYTMPKAEVTLVLSNGQKLTTTADIRGYYEFILRDLKVGKYTIYAISKYNGIDSLTPTKNLNVSVLTSVQKTTNEITKQTGKTFNNAAKSIWDLFTSWGLGILWLVIPIIILIIILIFKLWGDKFSSIFKFKFPVLKPVGLPPISFPIFFQRKRPLHHAWFIGF